MKYILSAVMVFLVMDFIAFIAWALSGQMPVDSFFLGAVTKSIINIII